MPNYFDPRRFVGYPMVLKSMVESDASAMIYGLRAGRILWQVMSGQRQVYTWTLTSPYTVSAGVTSSDEQETLEGAKAAIREAFDVWLKWALSQEKPVVWCGYLNRP